MVHFRGQAGLYGEIGVSFGMISGVTRDHSQDPEDANALSPPAGRGVQWSSG